MGSSSENDRGGIGQNWSRPISVFRTFDARRYPTDLAVLSLIVLTSALGILILPRGDTIRALVALPMAFLWPGYALLRCLFGRSLPGRPGQPNGDVAASIGLSFGLSLAVLPLLLLFAGGVVALTLPTVLGTLSAFTLVTTQVAAAREFNAGRRSSSTGSLSVPSLFGDSHGEGRRHRLVTLCLVLAMVAAVGTVTVAVAHPPSENEYTELSLATQGDGGELTAGDYPSTVRSGEAIPLVTGVENAESTTHRYVVVAQLQRVDEDGTVTAREELTRFSKVVEPGETWEHEHEVTPTTTGEDLRLTYLLYRDEAPDRPRRATADRSVYVWVTVEGE